MVRQTDRRVLVAFDPVYHLSLHQVPDVNVTIFRTAKDESVIVAEATLDLPRGVSVAFVRVEEGAVALV